MTRPLLVVLFLTTVAGCGSSPDSRPRSERATELAPLTARDLDEAVARFKERLEPHVFPFDDASREGKVVVGMAPTIDRTTARLVDVDALASRLRRVLEKSRHRFDVTDDTRESRWFTVVTLTESRRQDDRIVTYDTTIKIEFRSTDGLASLTTTAPFRRVLDR